MPQYQPGQVVAGHSYLGGDPSNPASWKPLTGDAFLQSMPEDVQPLIKAYSEGRAPVPSGSALRDPNVMQVLKATAQYDPTFNAFDYATRASTRKDFTSGKSAQNITSFNTVLQHLMKLQSAADALHNHEMPAENAIGNYIEPMLGDPRVNNFNTVKQAATSELTRAFRGSSGNEADIQAWDKTLNPNMSPEQLKGAIQQGVELLKGRIDALGDQFNRGMGRTQDSIQLLSPGAQQAFKALTAPEQPKASDAAPAGWSIRKIP